MTLELCSSSALCRAASHCLRNVDNQAPEYLVSNPPEWASFHPEAGYGCPRFWDIRYSSVSESFNKVPAVSQQQKTTKGDGIHGKVTRKHGSGEHV